jgi:BirA family biotin operon repressor/biotin-[acetyl-CoA-carboxylase] ligase
MAKSPEATLLNDYHLLSYDVLDSTSAEAKRLAGGGASHGAVIWAKRQTAGRGRMGREWVSAEGNLYTTVLLSPQVPLAKCPQLSFVAALAVAETLEAIVPDASLIACKWPNDVLVGGKKIAGILLESFSTKELVSARQWIAVGVGINVDNFPEHVMFPATCLRDAGVELISAKIVLSRLIHNFIHRYDEWAAKGFAPIEKAWKTRAYQLGKTVEVLVGEDQVSGIFDGIDGQGQMLLRDKKKNITAISAGDVFYKEPA